MKFRHVGDAVLPDAASIEIRAEIRGLHSPALRRGVL